LKALGFALPKGVKTGLREQRLGWGRKLRGSSGMEDAKGESMVVELETAGPT
jgi:hypothetical protein